MTDTTHKIVGIRTHHWGWIVITASIIFQAFVVGMWGYSFTFWIQPWSDAFSASHKEVMIAYTVSQFVFACCAPITGRLLDRFPVSRIVTTGLLLYGVGLFLISRASSLWQIYLCYACFIGTGASLAGSLPGHWLAVRWFKNNTGLALGLVSMGTSIGGLVLPPILILMLETFDWRLTYAYLSAVPILLLVPLALLVLRPPDTDEQPQLSDNSPASVSTFELLRSPRFWLIVMSLQPLILTISIFMVNLAPFAADLGFGAQDAALVMSTLSAGIIAGKIGIGVLVDRLDFRRVFGDN